MENNSRTKNSIQNITTSLLGTVICDGLDFIVRTVFIWYLGKEYLGLNGLFNNILTLLSITELGIGTSIVYNLYKPIAENDIEKIKSYMRLYKVCYTSISLFIGIIGVCLIPFLDYFMAEKPNIPESYIIIYLFFLVNTCVSYLFTYKRSLIIANQKLSIVNIYTMIIRFCASLIQVVTLILFTSYFLYLSIMVVCTITTNIIISNKCNVLYPYIKSVAVPLERKEIISVFKDIKAMFLYRFCDNFMSGTDSLFISKFINITIVGLYSNYTVITNTVRNIMTKIFDSITASIGNLNATANVNKKREIFFVHNFAAFWLNAFSSISIYFLLPSFIKIWIGSSYILPDNTFIPIVILFYMVGILIPVSQYRYATGLFRYGQIRAILMPILNIICSYLLVLKYGLSGIFWGTIIARIITQVWFDPLIVFKHSLGNGLLRFYTKNLLYIFSTLITGLLTYMLMQAVNISNIIIDFIIKILICCIVPNLIFYILFYNTNELQFIKNRILKR